MISKEDKLSFVYQEDVQKFISISDKIWDRMVYKIKSIKIHKHFELANYVIAAATPVTISIICDICNSKQPNYLPMIICTGLYILSKALEKIWPDYFSDNMQVNISHLQELKIIIEQAYPRKQDTTNKSNVNAS